MTSQPMSRAAGDADVDSIRPSAATFTVMKTSSGWLVHVEPVSANV